MLMNPSPLSTTSTQNVYTCVRFRPQLDPTLTPLQKYISHTGDDVAHGSDECDENTADTPTNGTSTLRIAKEVSMLSSKTSTMNEHKYTFDRVFDSEAQNDDVFRHTWPQVWDSLKNGYNANFCCYGQTGSGKTHTIDAYIETVLPNLFKCLHQDMVSFSVEASYVQIYLDTVCNLFDSNKQLTRAGSGVAKVENINNPPREGVESAEVLQNMLRRAHKHKKHAEHALNKRSSRSHTILVLHLAFTRHDGVSFSPKCYIVDLAGSERASRTGATGVVFEESCAINKSLSCLAKCLEAMSNKQSLIPFRESVLTMVLKEALSNTFFILLCCCSPDLRDEDETKCTLNFATVARRIVISRSAAAGIQQRKAMRLQAEAENARRLGEMKKAHEEELAALHDKAMQAQLAAMRNTQQINQHKQRAQSLQLQMEQRDAELRDLSDRAGDLETSLFASRNVAQLWEQVCRNKTMMCADLIGDIRSAVSSLEPVPAISVLGPSSQVSRTSSTCRSNRDVLYHQYSVSPAQPSFHDFLSELTSARSEFAPSVYDDEDIYRMTISLLEDQEDSRRRISDEETRHLFSLLSVFHEESSNTVVDHLSTKLASACARTQELQLALNNEHGAKTAMHTVLMASQGSLEQMRSVILLHENSNELSTIEADARRSLEYEEASLRNLVERNSVCLLLSRSAALLEGESASRQYLEDHRIDEYISLSWYFLRVQEKTLREEHKHVSAQLLSAQDTTAYFQNELDLTMDVMQKAQLETLESHARYELVELTNNAARELLHMWHEEFLTQWVRSYGLSSIKLLFDAEESYRSELEEEEDIQRLSLVDLCDISGLAREREAELIGDLRRSRALLRQSFHDMTEVSARAEIEQLQSCELECRLRIVHDEQSTANHFSALFLNFERGVAHVHAHNAWLLEQLIFEEASDRVDLVQEAWVERMDRERQQFMLSTTHAMRSARCHQLLGEEEASHRRLLVERWWLDRVELQHDYVESTLQYEANRLNGALTTARNELCVNNREAAETQYELIRLNNVQNENKTLLEETQTRHELCFSYAVELRYMLLEAKKAIVLATSLHDEEYHERCRALFDTFEAVCSETLSYTTFAMNEMTLVTEELGDNLQDREQEMEDLQQLLGHKVNECNELMSEAHKWRSRMSSVLQVLGTKGYVDTKGLMTTHDDLTDSFMDNVMQQLLSLGTKPPSSPLQFRSRRVSLLGSSAVSNDDAVNNKNNSTDNKKIARVSPSRRTRMATASGGQSRSDHTIIRRPTVRPDPSRLMQPIGRVRVRTAEGNVRLVPAEEVSEAETLTVQQSAVPKISRSRRVSMSDELGMPRHHRQCRCVACSPPDAFFVGD